LFFRAVIESYWRARKNLGMKCDLHVHTRHSGKCSIPLLKRICRESYNDPEAVYQSLKRRGMDLVTVTDHDSIDAAESLRRYPDFFLSEEVSVEMPDGGEMHMGVYDINERQHMEIQRRRNDLTSLIVYLQEQGLFFSANHVFSSLTGRRTAADFDAFEQFFPAIETLNGCMLQRANRTAGIMAARSGKCGLGGSDAHAMLSLGTAWTEAPEARTRQEFLDCLRAGVAHTAGTSGNYFRLTRDIFSIGFGMVSENPWTAPVALLGGLVPLITLINYWKEAGFVRQWAHRALAAEMPAPMEAMPEEVAA
jgi:predicted metal-dependent phosphoesterase TrpH